MVGSKNVAQQECGVDGKGWILLHQSVVAVVVVVAAVAVAAVVL